jgi:hypothetical protein
MKMETERTNRELICAEVKLRRSLETGTDMVSGFSRQEIEDWLNETPKGRVILNRRVNQVPA